MLEQVVSKNDECQLEALHVSNNIDYVPLRCGGIKAVMAATRELEMV